MSDPLTVFTVGHSTRPMEEFLAILKAHRIGCLVDVRSYPQSRRHPHFGQEALKASLASAGVRYLWTKELGGRRRITAAQRGSAGGANLPDQRAQGVPVYSGIRAPAFQAYIQHLATREASHAIGQVLLLAGSTRVALMCAEKSYRRCHRQFLADLLKSLGTKVLHIEDEGPPEEHTYHPLLLTGH